MPPPEKMKTPTSGPRRDSARDQRRAVARDADKTEVKDRDLEHGDGGTLGLAKGADQRRDD
jgi:hypothetical protein